MAYEPPTVPCPRCGEPVAWDERYCVRQDASISPALVGIHVFEIIAAGSTHRLELADRTDRVIASTVSLDGESARGFSSNPVNPRLAIQLSVAGHVVVIEARQYVPTLQERYGRLLRNPLRWLTQGAADYGVRWFYDVQAVDAVIRPIVA